jgi:hypothetical protein
MNPDDLLPNDSTFFFIAEPKEQVVSRQKEKAHTLEALPVLKALIKRLENQIKFYEKNSSVPAEVRTNPTEFLIMSNSHLLAAQVLQGEKEYIEGLLEEHAPNL